MDKASIEAAVGLEQLAASGISRVGASGQPVVGASVDPQATLAVNLPQPAQPAASDSGACSHGGAPTSSLSTHRTHASTPRSRAARATLADAVLHPVLRLGWRSSGLCEVVCNGLHGLLLGGHDKDIYIRATSGQWEGRPPVDVSQGGAVMTASQFERAAGRELSKKWKESIHVVGEGEGSRATLLAWLKRRAESEYGPTVVGRQVWVCWCGDGEFHLGTIAGYNSESGKHRVVYTARSPEHLHLPLELLSFDAERPQAPLSTAPAAGAARLAASCGGAKLAAGQQQHHQQQLGVPAQQAAQQQEVPAFLLRRACKEEGDDYRPANPVWNQGSGVSVSSTSFLDDGSCAAVAAAMAAAVSALGSGKLAVAEPAPAGKRRGGTKQQEQPATKRARTPPAAPTPEAAGGAAAQAAVPLPPAQQQEQLQGQQAAEAEAGAGELAPTPPAEQLQQEQAQQTQQRRRLTPFGSAITLPEELLAQQAAAASNGGTPIAPGTAAGGLPLPPAGGLVASTAEMSAWCHGVVLALEDSLRQAAVSQPPPAPGATLHHASTTPGAAQPAAPPAQAPAGQAPAPGPAARFQVLLALARGNDRSLRGLYEAMLLRFQHFHHTAQPALAAGEPASVANSGAGALLHHHMSEFVLAALEVAFPAATVAVTAPAALPVPTAHPPVLWMPPHLPRMQEE